MKTQKFKEALRPQLFAKIYKNKVRFKIRFTKKKKSMKENLSVQKKKGGLAFQMFEDT